MRILNTDPGRAESSNIAGKRDCECSAVALSLQVLKSSMEVCFYESLVKHRKLSSYAQFPVIQRIVCL